jgi:hypothetical protein
VSRPTKSRFVHWRVRGLLLFGRRRQALVRITEALHANPSDARALAPKQQQDPHLPVNEAALGGTTHWHEETPTLRQ